MAKVDGKLIGIYVAGVKVGDAMDCTLTVNQEIIKILSKDDSNWEDALPGARTWSVSVDYLWDETNSFGSEEAIDLILDASKVVVEFSQAAGSTLYFYGNAYADSSTINAPKGFTNGSITFIGVDALNKATITQT